MTVVYFCWVEGHDGVDNCQPFIDAMFSAVSDQATVPSKKEKEKLVELIDAKRAYSLPSLTPRRESQRPVFLSNAPLHFRLSRAAIRYPLVWPVSGFV